MVEVILKMPGLETKRLAVILLQMGAAEMQTGADIAFFEFGHEFIA